MSKSAELNCSSMGKSHCLPQSGSKETKSINIASPEDQQEPVDIPKLTDSGIYYFQSIDRPISQNTDHPSHSLPNKMIILRMFFSFSFRGVRFNDRMHR